MGPSGVGKKFALRAIAGLWNAGSGTIITPPRAKCCSAQRPYLIGGYIGREQLLYPYLDASVTDERLIQVLASGEPGPPCLPTGMGWIMGRTGPGCCLPVSNNDWPLPVCCCTKPPWAILDEATSALDEKNEARLYGQLANTATTFISVGHRPSLVAVPPADSGVGNPPNLLATGSSDFRLKTLKLIPAFHFFWGY